MEKNDYPPHESVRLKVLELVGLDKYEEAIRTVFPDYADLSECRKESSGAAERAAGCEERSGGMEEYEVVKTSLPLMHRTDLLAKYGPEEYPRIMRAFFSDYLPRPACPQWEKAVRLLGNVPPESRDAVIAYLEAIVASSADHSEAPHSGSESASGPENAGGDS